MLVQHSSPLQSILAPPTCSNHLQNPASTAYEKMTCHCDQLYCVDTSHFVVETTTTSAPGSPKRLRMVEEEDEDDEKEGDDDNDDDDANAKHNKAKPEQENFHPAAASTTPSTLRSRTVSQEEADDYTDAQRIELEPCREIPEPVEAPTILSTLRSHTLSREPEDDYVNANRITLPSIWENINYLVPMAMPFSEGDDIDFSHVQLPPIRSNSSSSECILPKLLQGEIGEDDVTELPNGRHVLAAASSETEQGLFMEIEQD
jgi:hypothetical protein